MSGWVSAGRQFVVTTAGACSDYPPEPRRDAQTKSGLRKIRHKVSLDFAKVDWTRHHCSCLVQLKIAGGAPHLLGFAKYVWTVPVQVVQIHLAFSATGITVSSGCSPWRVRSSVISRVQARR
jgi:hypothetical protein